MELWFTEKHTQGVGFTLKVKRGLYSKRSKYQQIDVLETEEFGRVLLLDGLVMTSDRDEFIYHEMLVHPAMHIHKEAKRVVVIGGGDGGAVREILKYPFITEVILCEIDKEVIDVARDYFPQLALSLNDKRVKIVCEDGFKFLEASQKGCFDIIFVDSTDPIGAAKALFSKDFYSICFDSLSEKGLLIAQSESPFYHMDIIKSMKEDVERAGFENIRFYTAPIPSYPGGYWSWLLAAKNKNSLELSFKARLDEKQYDELRYYNKDIHLAAFLLPNFFKKFLAN